MVPRNGGLLWQGAPAGRALVVVRLRLASGWPVSDDFVGFRAWESWRHGPRALEWRRVGAGRLCQTETAGGAIVRVASAVRQWGRRPKCCHGSVMLDVDVCAGISNGLWPRGASLPMVHCQRRITRGSPRRAGLRRCMFYGRIPRWLCLFFRLAVHPLPVVLGALAIIQES